MTAQNDQRLSLHRFLLVCLAAGLVWLSLPRLGENTFPVLIWIGLVPLGLALVGTPPVAGVLCGFLFGFLAYFAACSGLIFGVRTWLRMSVESTLLWYGFICAFQALPYAVFGGLQGVFGWLGKPFGALRAAAGFCLSLSLLPQIIPGNFANALYASPVFIQVLDLGGMPVLLFILILTNWLVVDFILCLKQRQVAWKTLAALSVLLAGTAGYGKYRLDQLHGQAQRAETQQRVRIISVQPDIPTPFEAGYRTKQVKEHLFDSTLGMADRIVKDHSAADLLVLPEMPVYMRCKNESFRKKLATLAKETNLGVLANCIHKPDDSSSEKFNAVRLTRPSGEAGPYYHKMLLFPFAEYIPREKEFPWLRRIFKKALRMTPGNEYRIFDLEEGKRVIPLICYESIFPDLVGKFVHSGGNVIVNMSDDAWFGRSDMAMLHFSLALFSTVEYRVPMARVTNSGVSAFIEATGEIVPGSMTPLFEEAVTSFPLFIPQERSPYYAFGDWFLWALLALLAADLYRNRRKNTRPRTDAGPTGAARFSGDEEHSQ